MLQDIHMLYQSEWPQSTQKVARESIHKNKSKINQIKT